MHTVILTTLTGIVTITTLSFFASALPVDYGYWDVNVTSGNAASGYRWGDIYAEYSGEAERISHSSWEYSPVYRNVTTTSDNPEFGSNRVDYAGDQRMSFLLCHIRIQIANMPMMKQSISGKTSLLRELISS